MFFCLFFWAFFFGQALAISQVTPIWKPFGSAKHDGTGNEHAFATRDSSFCGSAPFFSGAVTLPGLAAFNNNVPTLGGYLAQPFVSTAAPRMLTSVNIAVWTLTSSTTYALNPFPSGLNWILYSSTGVKITSGSATSILSVLSGPIGTTPNYNLFDVTFDLDLAPILASSTNYLFGLSWPDVDSGSQNINWVANDSPTPNLWSAPDANTQAVVESAVTASLFMRLCGQPFSGNE